MSVGEYDAHGRLLGVYKEGFGVLQAEAGGEMKGKVRKKQSIAEMAGFAAKTAG